MRVQLYTKDAKGKLRTWIVVSTYEGFTMAYGEFGSRLIYKSVDVVPKSNRTKEEQISLEITSRISKQMDKGYVETIEQAQLEPKTNALGLLKPMLATPIANVKNANYNNAVIQRKYNGHRCLITNTKGVNMAYSRNGKPITTVDHILRYMDMPNNTTVDGELYIHGMPLQAISSRVKKQQVESGLLRFVAYDLVSPDTYMDRVAELAFLLRNEENASVAPFEPFTLGQEEECMNRYVAEGFEGAIIRLDGYGYEDSKRSKGLIKVKPKYDEEFEVVDIVQSSDGWAVLVCKIPWTSSAETFKVSAPGTLQNKHKIYRERTCYIGKTITVEYYELTKGKVPFHPVALDWRDKNNE